MVQSITKRGQLDHHRDIVYPTPDLSSGLGIIIINISIFIYTIC